LRTGFHPTVELALGEALEAQAEDTPPQNLCPVSGRSDRNLSNRCRNTACPSFPAIHKLRARTLLTATTSTVDKQKPRLFDRLHCIGDEIFGIASARLSWTQGRQECKRSRSRKRDLVEMLENTQINEGFPLTGSSRLHQLLPSVGPRVGKSMSSAPLRPYGYESCAPGLTCR
jgi:hypothetical protein